MARSRGQQRLMALCYLDMDRFKAVNDFHGHGIGDLLLQAFARRVQRCVRQGDAVARLGGDEFAVILEDLGSAAAARRVAQAIVESVGRHFHINGIVADVDVSIGVALYRGAPMADHELLRAADVLLYRAKAAGRGRYEIGRTNWPAPEPDPASPALSASVPQCLSAPVPQCSSSPLSSKAMWRPSSDW